MKVKRDAYMHAYFKIEREKKKNEKEKTGGLVCCAEKTLSSKLLMGRQFVANYGGLGLLYSCKICDTYLTSHGELSSPNFTGGTGPAMLFRKVWNIEHGSPVGRKMTTGYHIVRDVSCLVCKNRVGWMYEMAYEPSQEYKEGQVILECELICRQNAIEDPLGADRIDIVEKKPHIHFERPSGRRRQRGRNSRSGSDESFSSDSSNSRSNNSSFSS